MAQLIPRRRRFHEAEPPLSPDVKLAVDHALAAVRPVRPDKGLPLLQQIQAQLGYLPPDALTYASRESGIPIADLNSLLSFYDLLSTDPDGTVVVHVCNDVVCRATKGADDFAVRMRELGHKVRFANCLGQCDKAPVALQTIAGSDQYHVYGGYTSWQLETGGSFPTGAAAKGWPGGYRPILLERCGQYDHQDLNAYGRVGGLRALRRARSLEPRDVVDILKESRLVGRGGAAFPTGIKWEGVLNAPTPLGPGPDGALKYVVVNADESEPGTFTNRVLMEEDPLSVLESGLIAAHAVGATKLFFYIRGEYPRAIDAMRSAIRLFYENGLSADVHVAIRVGGGRYICGEETALFESIEGKRGAPRMKPPFPTTSGVFGRPTLINNVETLRNVIPILLDGVDAWNAVEPKLFSIAGHVQQPGVYELPMGAPLAQLIALAGGPVGKTQAVLMGGASGMFLGPDQLETPLSFRDMAAAGATLGSGAVMVFDETVDLWEIARRVTQFFAEESCGKCTPCRIGTARQVEIADRLAAGETNWVGLFQDLSRAMADASICGLGQTATNAVKSLLKLKGV